MNKHQQLIQTLSNNHYDSYALTMTYLSSGSMQERYNDDVIYLKYGYNNNDATNLHDELASKLEKITLLIFNKFYIKLLKYRHITRNCFKPLHPIVFYYFETTPIDERRSGLQNTPGYRNICPVHLHAMVMIPSSVDVSDYLGDDTLKSLHPSLQSSQLKVCQQDWLNYIRKGAADYDSFFGYGSSHPVTFRDNPESYLNSIGIACSQSTLATDH